ncbi:PhoH family protein [bacterium]|nr:PhoH family protein [bacterium]
MFKFNHYIVDSNHLQNILGEFDKNLKALIYYFSCNIVVTSKEVHVDSQDDKLIKKIEDVFNCLYLISLQKISIRERDTIYVASIIDTISVSDIVDFYKNRKEIVKNINGKSLYPKTFSQVEYIKNLNKNDVVLSYGPAGVGKTYLAVCDAVKKFKSGVYSKIILSRPIVEAGESLGFLPGEIKEKVDPYLTPLYDSLYELLGRKAVDEYIENGLIEIAPLAYMRGRTLENAYIILDEAQNTTKKQMKLFLTRLGFNAKMVITGDLTQIDLMNAKDSGLKFAIERLSGIPGIKIMEFTKNDVVRNPLVQRIIERFEDD